MKRHLLPLPIIFAVLFAPLQGGGDTAYACSCIGTTVEERVEDAVLVATGTVVSVEQDSMTVDSKDGETEIPDVDGLFAIDAYYKGMGPEEIAVDDPPDGGTCGFVSPGAEGRQAVLYLDTAGGEYTTHICAGSGFLPDDSDEAASIIAEIEAVTGPGVPPQEEVDAGPSGGAPLQEGEPESEHEDTPWAVILPLAFGIPLAVLLVPAFLRRRGGGH